MHRWPLMHSWRTLNGSLRIIDVICNPYYLSYRSKSKMEKNQIVTVLCSLVYVSEMLYVFVSWHVQLLYGLTREAHVTQSFKLDMLHIYLFYSTFYIYKLTFHSKSFTYQHFFGSKLNLIQSHWWVTKSRDRERSTMSWKLNLFNTIHLCHKLCSYIYAHTFLRQFSLSRNRFSNYLKVFSLSFIFVFPNITFLFLTDKIIPYILLKIFASTYY